MRFRPYLGLGAGQGPPGEVVPRGLLEGFLVVSLYATNVSLYDVLRRGFGQ
jgi:hypothetical protein